MTAYRIALLLGLAACVGDEPDDTDLAGEDLILEAGGAADSPGWEPSDTLHANSKLYDAVGANARRVHSMWIAGSAASPVPMTITARAPEGSDVRISVLGPIANGTRPTLGADGYSAAKRTAKVTFNATAKGEYLVVVGSYKLARDTSYNLTASCTSCAAKVDAIRTPKELGLVGNSSRVVDIKLGNALASYPRPLQVEVWASPPMLSWTAKKVATAAVASNAASVTLPTSVKAGDDLVLVVREKDGRTLDTGVLARNIRTQTAFARTDAVLFDDLTGMQVAGVVGFFEGQATMRLRSETKKRTLDDVNVRATSPGQVGNGFNSFNAHFVPDVSVAARDGEILSVGWISDEDGGYKRLGCFEYCNDLAGTGSCTGGSRTCP